MLLSTCIISGGTTGEPGVQGVRLKENIMNERMPLMDSFNLFICGSNTSASRCVMQWVLK